MLQRKLLGDLGLHLLFALAGAVGGVGFGLLLTGRVVAGLDLRTDVLLRTVDLPTLSLARSLFTGTLATVLPILCLALAVVTLGLGVVLQLRGQERKVPTLIALLIGLAVGGLALVPLLLFGSSLTRTQAALTAAGYGAASILRAVALPRILAATLTGTTLLWMVGAARAATWRRRILLGLLGLVPLAGVVATLLLARPPLVELPRSVPQLAAGEGEDEETIWVIGGSDKAIPVVVTLSAFLATEPGKTPLKVNRRNVARAIKAAKRLPELHPSSVAAERLIAAGAMAELTPIKAARRLLDTFERRGNNRDGMLAAATLGNLAPSPEATKLLARATGPAIQVGPWAAKRLCELARAAGSKAIGSKLACTGTIEQRPTGTLKASIYLKGRPLRRAAVGVIAEPEGQGAPWVKKGRVSAAALKLVAGARTKGRGDLTVEHLLPGTYLLAVSPRRPSKIAEPLDLTKAVRVEIPESGGVVDLGVIEVGGPALGRGPGHRRPAKLAALPPREDAVSPVEPGTGDTAGGSAATKVAPAVADGPPAQPLDRGAQKVATPRPVKARPLPRVAKRLVSKIRPAGPDRVIVPEGFGTSLLEAESAVLAPTASVAPEKGPRGRAQGLKLTGIRPNGVLVALGFQEGDVIKSVNGRPTRDPDDLVDLVDALSEVQHIRVRVFRAGRPKVLTIEVDR